jgi:co-chaperonin GroES (HSP10)
MEILPFDEEQLPSSLYLPEDDEEKAGWVPGIIIACGNGLRLDVAPVPVVLPSDLDRNLPLEQKREMLMRSLSPTIPNLNEEAMVVNVTQCVPMLLVPGQEVIVEKYSGRKFRIQGRNFRTMAQVDCIQPTGRFYRWDEEEGWIQRDLAAEQAAREANGKILRP